VLGASYRIARVWGIPIRVHLSLAVFLAILAVAGGWAGAQSYGRLGALRGTAELLGVALGIFTSIALHELGHSLVAMAKRCRVRDITLFFFGGVAQMERIPARPRDEIEMALAGPLVSAALGAVIWVGGGFLPLPVESWPMPFLRSRELVCNLVQLVGVVNFGLTAFNLLPAFPMDGGRVLRALLVRRFGRLGATRLAARLGKLIAVVFVIRGLAHFSTGWYLALMGFFLYGAAAREYRHERMLHRARHGGGSFGFPFEWFGAPDDSPPPEDDGDDRVVISPPPYERGPDREAEIRRARRRPWWG
jgi:Zn-dependent protease